ncbi:tetratricopeptide repeat protein [Spirochaeta cellobiosiphila]|uniref:tetratricopeptide repeat protein n=1 Tax=Spirochaeta cellobiosiphila TaxID=504483 RepID=UPI000403EE5E|nr:tetratricopeptide repeat protein [Spirochaeta cellobiosiphila]
MPKALSFKANSVIYFRGDVADKIYILKDGRLLLTSADIETGQEIRELIQTGEFFGVKSAMGKYPRDETAMVLTDSQVILFSVPEFENLVLSNTRIIMKMLKVFSNQLRRIHKQVQNLIGTNDDKKPDEGLWEIAEYYRKNNMTSEAMYTYQRYLTYYPEGVHAVNATSILQKLETYVPTVSDTSGKAGVNELNISSVSDTSVQEETARGYYDAVSLFSQNKFVDALKAFKKIIDEDQDQEHIVKSEYEMGRCFYMLEQYDNCVRHMSGLIQKYPKHPDLKECLFYIGQSYQMKGDSLKAKNFYTKILKMAQEDEPVTIKVKRVLRKMERGDE